MAEQAINVNNVPVGNPTANTKLVGVENGAWLQVPAASIKGNYQAPQINLAVIKEDVWSNYGNVLVRSRGSLLVSIRFKSIAEYYEFMQTSPQIVMLRQSGNSNNWHGMTDHRARQKTKRFAYTRKRLSATNQLNYYPFYVPQINRSDAWYDYDSNIFSFILRDGYANDEPFTYQHYFNQFCHKEENGNIVAITIRRGGIQSRKAIYNKQTGGITPNNKNMYASSLLGFQLFSGDARSNIVYVKFKVIVYYNNTSHLYDDIRTWSILP
jgi:hypothetical protein